MQIAITGGSGRLGRVVVELALAQRHTVVSIDRVAPAEGIGTENVTFVSADVTDYEGFEQALRGCDALVHLAAIPSPHDFPGYVVHNNNVVGSYNALSAAVQVGIKRVCLASSINATGVAFNRTPHFDYLPLDEQHPSYTEDAYSLSKWIGERQADAFARRYDDLTLSSLRFHWIVPSREHAAHVYQNHVELGVRNLWGYTCAEAAARACLLALSAKFKGHEVFYIVGPDTTLDVPSRELARRFLPGIPIRDTLGGDCSFFDSTKAARLLGWRHDAGGE